MRVVLFGSGGLMPSEALRALVARHAVAAIVRPGGRSWRARLGAWARLVGLRAADPFLLQAKEAGVPVLSARDGNDPALASQLRRIQPDLICIASFPWVLSESLFSLPRLGALNLHSSLLPRHRGPNPFFWTYYHDDRVTGVTAHVVTEQADGGAILGTQSFPLPRGMPLRELHAAVSSRGAELLARVVDSLEHGAATPRPQDPALVSKAPRVRPGAAMVDFAHWPTERVWHFLAGLCPYFREPLPGARYRAVTGFRICSPREAPGSVEKGEEGWRLWCLDGYVSLSAREAGR